MSKSWTVAAGAMGRWFGCASVALLLACGGGGGGGTNTAPPPEIPVVQPPAPEPLPPPAPEPVKVGSLEAFAGRPGGSGYLDGNGPDARFSLGDNGVAADAAGNVYVADGRAYIRRITPQGQVSTWATGVTRASALVMDKDGNFLVADAPGNRILKVSATGVVTTYAGSREGSVDGPAAVAQFVSPQGLALAADGTLYVSDGVGTIRKIGPDGMVSTLAGQAQFHGDVDGPGAQARFQSPGPLALDGQGRLVVADGRSIRTIDSAGNVSTTLRFDTTDAPGALAVRDGVLHVRSRVTGAVLKIVGNVLVPVTGPGPAGYADGPAADARFQGLGGMAFDGSGNLYLVDALNSSVRKLDTQGMVSTVAGAPASTDIALSRVERVTDGPVATARFNRPDSLAQDGAGNLYVSDYLSHTIRRISDGNVSTFAGTPGVSASWPSYISPTLLTFPSGLVSDAEGNLVVVEGATLHLHHVASTGVPGTSTSSGAASACYPFCNGGTRRGDVARDGTGGFYVSDTYLNVIRHVDASGQASVFAGTPAGDTSRVGPNGPGTNPPGTYAADGTGPAASFSSPGGLARDAAGNLYVADSGNNTIRRITPAGVVTTLAGVAGPPGDADGPGTSARFNYPVGLALDPAGNLYVADSRNALVRKITPDGMVSTVVGQRGLKGIATGPLPASLNEPFGLLLGKQGELYVTDLTEHVIVKITLP